MSVTMPGDVQSIAHIKCRVQTSSIVHWYVQKENGELKRILYVTLGSSGTVYDNGVSKNKFLGIQKSGEYTLTIKMLTDEDAGTYYCAKWEYSIHIEIKQQKDSTRKKKRSVIQIIRCVTVIDHIKYN
uniref:Immunoglobulin V-set domain-containing protein n=1 Tax=Pyxicephalus adspersus TaxID=30357 RepID=A0AAV3AE70_PYXAD|nr:TPA: hypothetical protein GDO54_012426 [Pyxicephalus adspersus]